MLDDNALIRYQRQLILPDWQDGVQENISKARIALIGAGGLGAGLAPYLAGLGVGHIDIFDDDIIELHNLHRQVIYTEADIGKAKATILANSLKARNSNITITAHHTKITTTNMGLLQPYHLLIDCSDDASSRNLINHISLHHTIALLTISAIGHSGQVLWLNNSVQAPCYACIFDAASHENVPQSRCDTMGVSPAIIMQITALALAHIIQYIGKKHNPASFMLLADSESADIHKINIQQNKNCRHPHP